ASGSVDINKAAGSVMGAARVISAERACATTAGKHARPQRYQHGQRKLPLADGQGLAGTH
ncbi:MAG: hypothetical protein WBD51_03115, partial [Burkholderiaceae bacterium]